MLVETAACDTEAADVEPPVVVATIDEDTVDCPNPPGPCGIPWVKAVSDSSAAEAVKNERRILKMCLECGKSRKFFKDWV